MAKRATKLGKVTLKDTWGGRFYVIGGDDYVSTTTPLSILSAPPIELWTIRVGKTRAGIIAKKAGNFGTKIHGYVAAHLEGKLTTAKWKEIHQRYRPELAAVIEWIEENVEIIIGVEKTVYSRTHKLAGTVDLICTLKERTGVYLIDWKTGRIKDEAFLQLSSYCKLTLECAADEFKGRALKLLQSEDIHRLIISIKMNTKGEGKIKEVPPILSTPEKDTFIDADWMVYLDVLGIWRWYSLNRQVRAEIKAGKKKVAEKKKKDIAKRKKEREKKRVKK